MGRPAVRSITLIDVDTHETRIVSIAAGGEGLTSNAGLFWVSNGTAGSVAVVDLGDGRIVRRIESVCGCPIALDGARGQDVWAACFGSGELAAINATTYTVERRFDLDAQPLNLAVHPSRNLAYASLPRQNAVAEVDLGTGTILRRITVGIEPDGLRRARSGQ